MQQRLLIAAFILVGGILFVRVPPVRATALGLADGNYTLKLDFVNNVFDTTATITIGTTGITAFHADIPTDGSFDCNPCTPNGDSPDRVLGNGAATTFFQMFSEPLATCNSNLSNCWGILLNSANQLALRTADMEPTPFGADRWSVPEPASLSMLGFGALVLYFRRRRLR